MGNGACPHPPSPPQTMMPVEERRESGNRGPGAGAQGATHTPLCPGGGNTATLSQTNAIHFEVLVHTKGHGERAGREAWVEWGTHRLGHSLGPRGQSSATRRAPAKWTAEHSPGWVPHMQQNDKHVHMCGGDIATEGDGGHGPPAQRTGPTIQ